MLAKTLQEGWKRSVGFGYFPQTSHSPGLDLRLSERKAAFARTDKDLEVLANCIGLLPDTRSNGKGNMDSRWLRMERLAGQRAGLRRQTSEDVFRQRAILLTMGQKMLLFTKESLGRERRLRIDVPKSISQKTCLRRERMKMCDHVTLDTRSLSPLSHILARPC